MSNDEVFTDKQESDQELLNEQVTGDDMNTTDNEKTKVSTWNDINTIVNEKPKISTWNKLATVNVNDNTEKKGKLTYLSWAWAWGITKKLCPDANYRVIDFDGKPYHFDENFGIMVQTEVTIEGETIPMHLFVMDGANKAQRHITYTYEVKNWKDVSKPIQKECQAATMFDINTAIMRCLAKNIAMHGLGHYIYAGHDLPPAPEFDYNTIQDSINAIIKSIANKEHSTAAEAWNELTKEEIDAAWIAKTKGGCFTTAEKEFIQSTEFREALNLVRGINQE